MSGPGSGHLLDYSTRECGKEVARATWILHVVGGGESVMFDEKGKDRVAKY